MSSPSQTTVAEQSEIYLTQVCGECKSAGQGGGVVSCKFCADTFTHRVRLQASLNVQSNVPEGTRVVLLCKYGGRSTVLCHFRVGVIFSSSAFFLCIVAVSSTFRLCAQRIGDSGACLNSTSEPKN